MELTIDDAINLIDTNIFFVLRVKDYKPTVIGALVNSVEFYSPNDFVFNCTDIHNERWFEPTVFKSHAEALSAAGQGESHVS